MSDTSTKRAEQIAYNLQLSCVSGSTWKATEVDASNMLRALAAERDALRAERNAEVGHRLKAEGALFNMERRIARHRRVLAKLYAKRHDRKAERDYLEKTALQAAQCHGRETLRADALQAENARLLDVLRAFPGFVDEATIGDVWIERKNVALGGEGNE